MSFFGKVINTVLVGFIALSSSFALAEGLALSFLPNPPALGKETVEIKIKDTKAFKTAKIEGEVIMPAMPGMGQMLSKVKVEKAGDKFIGKFNLSMEGTWYLKLITTMGKKTQEHIYKFSTGSKDFSEVKEIPTEMSGMHH